MIRSTSSLLGPSFLADEEEEEEGIGVDGLGVVDGEEVELEAGRRGEAKPGSLRWFGQV
jgi:hypothetical protein